MDIRTETLSLIDELHQAAEAYYQKDGTSLLTDEEFDAKLELLETYAENPLVTDLFEVNTKGWKLLENDVSLGTKVTADAIITHTSPMLSLGKAKNRSELENFVKKMKAAGAKNFTLQAKLDGFAVSACYKNGQLQTLATRGDGTVGEDITYLVNDPLLTVQGLPTTINLTEDIEVRGEIYFTHEQFTAADNKRFTLTGEYFKNSRNAVVGLMKKAKLGLDYPVEFTFSIYSVYTDSYTNFDKVNNEGFLTVTEVTKEQAPLVKLSDHKTDEEFFEAVLEFGEARKTFTIPTDGVVIKPANEVEMMKALGSTSHHPVSQIAYKYPGETADSTVLAITVTVGKTGKLTPCAHIKKVLVDGSEIENFTMNNYNWVAEKDVRVGSEVRVHKANDIIPEIKIVLHNPQDSTPVEVPENCPVCNEKLAYDTKTGIWPPKTIKCINDDCPSRDFFALKTAVSKKFLDIDGLSEASLTMLNDIGRVNNIGDLYSLTLDELAPMTLSTNKQGNPIRLGESRAQNILDHIEKSKTLPFYRQLMALNIAHMGPSNAKALIKHFKTLENLKNATVEEIASIDGFAEIIAEKVVKGLELRKDLIATLQSHGMTFADTTTTSTDAHLTGYAFAISGEVPAPFANRNDWTEYIEANGGTFHSAPKADTTCLVGDENATSSKTVKAKKLGIQIISPEEWTATYHK